MRFVRLGAVALATKSVSAYLDSSPFFLFSTSADFKLTEASTSIQTSESLTKDVYKALSSCPTDKYILISQEGVTTSDYSSSQTTPHLASSLSPKSTQYRSRLSVPEVYNDIDYSSLGQVLIDKCDVTPLMLDAYSNTIPSSLKKNSLLTIAFPAPSRDSSRSAELSNFDAYLATVVDMLSSTDYTVIYTTTPYAEKDGYNASVVNAMENKMYEMDSQIVEAMHMELKRDTGAHEKRAGNQTIVDGPLFDRYQFLSPAIFMGLTVGLLLLSILYVGISALASLQVTYGAFDKDNGPLAGKKQQ